MEVFVTKVNGFQFLVIATKDLVLDIAGSYILCYLLMFGKKCACFAIFVLILIFISFDCNKLIINMFLNAWFFCMEVKIYFTFLYIL